MSLVRPESIVFVFLDGVGLGNDDPDQNPFAASGLDAFSRLANGPWLSSNPGLDSASQVFRAIDANLGMPGLPQSGTGQATLFTGVNCARRAGRHYGPFPHSTSLPVLRKDNIFTQLSAGPGERRVTFVNAYPERFFSYVDRTNRWTVTTRCCLDAGVRLRTYQDWKSGKALTADLTAAGWLNMGYNLQPITEAEAGERLAGIAGEHAFSLFEYFYTDKAGHGLSLDRARSVLSSVNRFLSGLLARLDPTRHLLVVTSDHGNIEDLSTKSHTRHPVPLAAFGAGAGLFARVDSICGVTPAIVRLLRNVESA